MKYYRFELHIEEEVNDPTQGVELYETRLAAKFAAVADLNTVLEGFDVDRTFSVDDLNWTQYGSDETHGKVPDWDMMISVHEMKVVHEIRRSPTRDGYSWERK